MFQTPPARRGAVAVKTGKLHKIMAVKLDCLARSVINLAIMMQLWRSGMSELAILGAVAALGMESDAAGEDLSGTYGEPSVIIVFCGSGKYFSKHFWINVGGVKRMHQECAIFQDNSLTI